MRWWPVTAKCFGILIAVATIGCGSDPEPKPVPIRLEITATASEDANPDATGSPSLIVVRLFVLRGQSAFAAADFFTLWDKEQAVLARDLVSREELVLKPGQTTRLVSVTGGDARVLGVAAAYQEIDGATWRAIAPIAEPHATAFMVELARRAVSVQPSAREDRPDRRAKEKNKEEQ